MKIKNIILLSLASYVGSTWSQPMMTAAEVQAPNAVNSLAASAQSAKSPIYLTPAELIKEATQRNASAVLEQLNWELAHQQRAFAQGVFEPTVDISLNRRNLHTPNSTEKAVSQQFQNEYRENAHGYDVAVKGLIWTGAEWRLGVNGDVRSSTIIDKYRKGGEEFENSLVLTFNQPLLKGFGSTATKSQIKVAEANQEIAYQTYRQRLMEVANAAVQGYWQLYGAQRLVENWQQSTHMASDLLGVVEKMVERGKLPSTEILEVKTSLSLRESQLRAAKAKELEARNRIYTLLNLSVSQNPMDLLAGQKPNIDDIAEIDMAQSVERALSNWPAYLIAQSKAKREQIQVQYEQNQAKPELDLVLSYNTNGLQSDRRQAWQDAFEPGYDSWSVGLNFSMPLFGGQQASSRIQSAQIREQQAGREIESVHRGLINNLNTKKYKLESSQLTAKAFIKDVESKQTLLAAEIDKLRAGKSSIREVMRQEEDLLEFQRRYLNSVVSLKVDEAIFQLAEGTLLDTHQVEVRRAALESSTSADDISRTGLVR